MAKYCLKNPKHKSLGADRCLVPGCYGMLGDTGVETAAEEALAGKPVAAVIASESPSVEPVTIVAKDPPTEPQAKPPVTDRPPVSPAGLQTVAPSDTAAVSASKSPMEKVEDKVRGLIDGDVPKLKDEIAALLEEARSKTTEAKQAADAALKVAQGAIGIAGQAGADAAPHADAAGFGEAARHAQGTQYHADVAKTAAGEAASHAAAASDALQTVEVLVQLAAEQVTPAALRPLIAEIKPAVELLVRLAAAAKDALERTKGASGEVSALGGFFTEALTLWRNLHL